MTNPTNAEERKAELLNLSFDDLQEIPFRFSKVIFRGRKDSGAEKLIKCLFSNEEQEIVTEADTVNLGVFRNQDFSRVLDNSLPETDEIFLNLWNYEWKPSNNYLHHLFLKENAFYDQSHFIKDYHEFYGKLPSQRLLEIKASITKNARQT